MLSPSIFTAAGIAICIISALIETAKCRLVIAADGGKLNQKILMNDPAVVKSKGLDKFSSGNFSALNLQNKRIVDLDRQTKLKNAESKEQRREEFLKKVQIIPAQDEYAQQLFQHWADQAFSSLFAAIADKKLKEMKHQPIHEEFGECSKQANNVGMHAKCVSDLFSGKFDGKKFIERAQRRASKFDRYRMAKRGQFRHRINKGRNQQFKIRPNSSPRLEKYLAKKSYKKLKQQKKMHYFINEQAKKKWKQDEEWIGSFRMMKDSPISREILPKNSIETTKLRVEYSKIMEMQNPKINLQIQRQYAAHRRERRQTGIVKKNYYELMTPSIGRLSPFGQIAQQMMQNVLKLKGKTENDIVPWQQTVQRIKETSSRRKELKKKLGEDELENMGQLTYRGLKKKGALEEEDLSEFAENPIKLRKFLDKKRKEIGKKGQNVERIVNLLKEGIKLGYAIAGQNTSEMDNKTLKMVSPRFLSVTPEDDPGHNETIDFISPSLFSIHDNGKGIENLTSIPNLIKSVGGPFGFSAKDQQMWLDFIMEASGALENAKRIEEELNGTTVLPKEFDKNKYEREIRTKDGTPLYFTKQNISDGFAESEVKKVDLFEWIQKNISKEQVVEMNNTGFTLLTKQQLNSLYGLGSPFQDLQAFHNFVDMDNAKFMDLLIKDIHTLAQVKSMKITPRHRIDSASPMRGNRAKRQAVVLSPVTFTSFISTFLIFRPLILSPIIFSPIILSPIVLGPAILSPGLFVPLVLSPRLLSPGILSPVAFVPFILSPIALSPFILNPGVFVPFVLSPFLLSPFILSPQVFTPVILSPLALSPFILTPAAASPLVLSPFVLSPIIYSPMYLSALVLSPYALSPVINSPLAAFAVILSPSYLS